MARSVNAPTAMIEDACQTAWLTLVRRVDITLDARGLRWLTTVATREAWNVLASVREVPAGPLTRGAVFDQDGEIPEPPCPGDDPGDRALARELHRERTQHLAALTPRERRELLLHAAGYSYAEIAEMTSTTYTAVNRYIAGGRARLRALTQEAIPVQPRERDYASV